MPPAPRHRRGGAYSILLHHASPDIVLKLRNMLVPSRKKAGLNGDIHGGKNASRNHNLWARQVEDHLRNVACGTHRLSWDEAELLRGTLPAALLRNLGIEENLSRVLEYGVMLYTPKESGASTAATDAPHDNLMADDASNAGFLSQLRRLDQDEAPKTPGTDEYFHPPLGDVDLDESVPDGVNLDISKGTVGVPIGFLEILRHNKEKHGWSMECVRELLGQLREFKPVIDYENLPKAPETIFLKVSIDKVRQ